MTEGGAEGWASYNKIYRQISKKIWFVQEQDFSDRWLTSIQKWMILRPLLDASEPS